MTPDQLKAERDVLQTVARNYADRIACLESLCKQAEEALAGLLDACHAGRLVPLDVASRGICAQVVHNGESALAAISSLTDAKETS